MRTPEPPSRVLSGLALVSARIRTRVGSSHKLRKTDVKPYRILAFFKSVLTGSVLCSGAWEEREVTNHYSSFYLRASEGP